MKIPLIAALVAGLPVACSAFTLDAIGYQGSDLSPNPISVFVPGYGELIFETTVGSTLVVDSAYRNDHESGSPALSFDPNEAVRITFNDLPPLKFSFDFVGVSAGGNFVVRKDLFTPEAFLVTLQGVANKAGF